MNKTWHIKLPNSQLCHNSFPSSQLAHSAVSYSMCEVSWDAQEYVNQPWMFVFCVSIEAVTRRSVSSDLPSLVHFSQHRRNGTLSFLWSVAALLPRFAIGMGHGAWRGISQLPPDRFQRFPSDMCPLPFLSTAFAARRKGGKDHNTNKCWTDPMGEEDIVFSHDILQLCIHERGTLGFSPPLHFPTRQPKISWDFPEASISLCAHDNTNVHKAHFNIHTSSPMERNASWINSVSWLGQGGRSVIFA